MILDATEPGYDPAGLTLSREQFAALRAILAKSADGQQFLTSVLPASPGPVQLFPRSSPLVMAQALAAPAYVVCDDSAREWSCRQSATLNGPDDGDSDRALAWLAARRRWAYSEQAPEPPPHLLTRWGYCAASCDMIALLVHAPHLADYEFSKYLVSQVDTRKSFDLPTYEFNFVHNDIKLSWHRTAQRTGGACLNHYSNLYDGAWKREFEWEHQATDHQLRIEFNGNKVAPACIDAFLAKAFPQRIHDISPIKVTRFDLCVDVFDREIDARFLSFDRYGVRFHTIGSYPEIQTVYFGARNSGARHFRIYNKAAEMINKKVQKDPRTGWNNYECHWWRFEVENRFECQLEHLADNYYANSFDGLIYHDVKDVPKDALHYVLATRHSPHIMETLISHLSINTRKKYKKIMQDNFGTRFFHDFATLQYPVLSSKLMNSLKPLTRHFSYFDKTESVIMEIPDDLHDAK